MRKVYRLPEIRVLDQEGRWDRNSEDEHLFWPRVTWLDPGTVSGVATVWFDPKAAFDGKITAKVVLAYSEMFLYGPEYGLNGQANRFLRLRKSLDTEIGMATGIESFVIRQFNQSEEFLSPVRISAAVEFALSRVRPGHNHEAAIGSIPVFKQSPSDAKNTFTNDRLKALRMFTPGPDHINDAKRHCLLWIRKLPAAGMDFFISVHGYEEGWFEQ